MVQIASVVLPVKNSIKTKGKDGVKEQWQSLGDREEEGLKEEKNM